MKKLLLLLLNLCITLSISAQEDAVERINTIKKSKQYLSAEAVMPTVDEATATAFEHLQDEIGSWAQSHCKKKKVEKIIVTDITNIVDTIVHRRANMYRVFTYVNKSNLIPIYQGKGYAIIDPDAKEGKTVPPATSVPQKKEELIQVVEDVKQNEGKEVTGNKNIVQDTTSCQVPVKDNTAVAEERTSQSGDDEAIESIKQVKSFFDLEKVLPRLKEEGKVTAYGKYATMTSPETSYLIIYDAAGNIRALLGKGTDERTNLKTGEADSTDNYHGCGAIWFTVNKGS